MMAGQQDDLRALLNDSGEPTLERAVAKAREKSDRLDNVTLNIAVTGETGAGKSSFVNAIRGLQDTDVGAAPTGVTETTMEPTMYPHPTFNNVKIWDLPGIGGIKFKAKTYMKDVKYQNYDFFIIVSASRFRENDIMLAKEIKKNEKNFYFVHTKTDTDVANEERNGGTEASTLEKIRNNCQQNLKPYGSPPVFLITSHCLAKFDFHELVSDLERNLPDDKRDVLVMSLPVYSKDCLDRKYNTFKNAVWAVAITSAGIAAAPVPGLSLACDIAMVVPFLIKCYYSFGLDDGSLEKVSKKVDKPILEEVKKSKLVKEIAKRKSILTNAVQRVVAAGIIEALCILMPGVGSVAAAVVSFATTRSLLRDGVDELYRLASRVLEMAEIK